jgi:ATP-dependent helicase IRC3
MAVMELRPYQVEALERVHKAAERGVMRQLGVAATGLGKTIIFCALAEQMGVRTLVIAHRDELIEQAVAKIKLVWPTVDVGVVKGARDEVHSRVVVASVQTLSRAKRLARLLAPTLVDDAMFGLVVVDEAHHSAATSYRTVLHGLRCGEDDGPLLLGVTATPDRGDGKGLDDLFDEVVFAYDIRWGIAQGYLSDLRGMRVTLATDLGSLKTRGGDYDQGQAGQMLEDAHAPSLIVRAWQQHANGRRTLVFTPTVALAEAVAAEYVAAGVRSATVDGAMPMEERRAVLRAYSRGEIDVLANCQVLTEGYDEPRTDCIIVARPTKSRALYTQMVGRGTRVHPEKADCLVIDVVGVTEMHDLVTVPSLFGIDKPAHVWDSERTVTDVLREQIERHAVEGRLLAAEAALFDKVRAARYAWVTAFRPPAQRRYELGIGDRGTLVMVELRDGVWRAGLAVRRDGVTEKRVLIDAVSQEMAQGVCEDYARKVGGEQLVSLDAAWRKARPSAKQRALCKKLHIDIPPGATKGDVSDLLGARFGAKRAKVAK